MKYPKNFKRAFTLAEALIVLVVIGTIAVLTMPSLRMAAGRSQYKTGITKAINSVNNVIANNITNANGSPYKTSDLCNYISNGLTAEVTCQDFKDDTDINMIYAKEVTNNGFSWSTPQTRQSLKFKYTQTNDGIQFFFPTSDTERNGILSGIKLRPKEGSSTGEITLDSLRTGYCGSKGTGARANADVQDTLPCIVLVDVNGATKPNILSTNGFDDKDDIFDMFLLIVTEKDAYPYGTAAQKAYYGEKW